MAVDRNLVRHQLETCSQVHATLHGYFTSLNHNFAYHPCKIGAGVGSLPADLNFPETSEVEVWKPVAVPQMTKLDPAILGELFALHPMLLLLKIWRRNTCLCSVQ